MDTKDLPFNDGTQRHHVKYFIKSFPNFESNSFFAFVVESLKAIYTADLMMSSEEEHIFREFDLVAQEQSNTLK